MSIWSRLLDFEAGKTSTDNIDRILLWAHISSFYFNIPAILYTYADTAQALLCKLKSHCSHIYPISGPIATPSLSSLSIMDELLPWPNRSPVYSDWAKLAWPQTCIPATGVQLLLGVICYPRSHTERDFGPLWSSVYQCLYSYSESTGLIGQSLLRKSF